MSVKKISGLGGATLDTDFTGCSSGIGYGCSHAFAANVAGMVCDALVPPAERL